MAGDTQVRLSRLDRRILLLLMSGAANLHHLEIVRLTGWSGIRAMTRLSRFQAMGWVTAVPTSPNRGPVYKITKAGRYYGMLAMGLRTGDGEDG